MITHLEKDTPAIQEVTNIRDILLCY